MFSNRDREAESVSALGRAIIERLLTRVLRISASRHSTLTLNKICSRGTHEGTPYGLGLTSRGNLS